MYLIERIEKLDAAQRNGQDDAGRPLSRLFRFLLLEFLDGSFGRFRSADVPHQRRAQILNPPANEMSENPNLIKKFDHVPGPRNRRLDAGDFGVCVATGWPPSWRCR